MKQDVKYFLKIVPPGIIQFLPSQGSLYSKHAINSPHLAALHFTGSTPVKILKIKKKRYSNNYGVILEIILTFIKHIQGLIIFNV
jgi:acyl-CoA reductase-like NAD-dependent aldehyde dehydrogenase